MSTENSNNKSAKKNIRFEHELIEAIENHKDPLIPFASWVKNACRVQLEREGAQLSTPAYKRDLVTTSQPKIAPVIPPKDKSGRKPTANERRSAETIETLKNAVKALTSNKKAEVYSAKNKKIQAVYVAIDRIVSKDSISKYWDEIEPILKAG